MSALALPSTLLAIDIGTTLGLLEELEGIKATSSFYRSKACGALEIGSDFYSKRDIRLNLKRNELVAAWKGVALLLGHPFVNERFNDTARELSLLCSTLDNKGGASLKDKFLLGTVALTEKFSFSTLTGLFADKIGEPTQREFSTSTEVDSHQVKLSRFSWIFATVDPEPSAEAITMIPLHEVPEIDLTPKKDLSPQFESIRAYWKIIKPIFRDNVTCLLKGKVRVSLAIKYSELRASEDWAPHIKNLSDTEKFLIPLRNFQSTLIKATELFFNATNAWTTISKLYHSGIDTIAEAAIIAAFDNQCYLKLASMKIRLVSLTTLIDDRARRYKEEFSKP